MGVAAVIHWPRRYAPSLDNLPVAARTGEPATASVPIPTACAAAPRRDPPWRAQRSLEKRPAVGHVRGDGNRSRRGVHARGPPPRPHRRTTARRPSLLPWPAPPALLSSVAGAFPRPPFPSTSAAKAPSPHMPPPPRHAELRWRPRRFGLVGACVMALFIPAGPRT